MHMAILRSMKMNSSKKTMFGLGMATILGGTSAFADAFGFRETITGRGEENIAFVSDKKAILERAKQNGANMCLNYRAIYQAKWDDFRKRNSQVVTDVDLTSMSVLYSYPTKLSTSKNCAEQYNTGTNKTQYVCLAPTQCDVDLRTSAHVRVVESMVRLNIGNRYSCVKQAFQGSSEAKVALAYRVAWDDRAGRCDAFYQQFAIPAQ